MGSNPIYPPCSRRGSVYVVVLVTVAAVVLLVTLGMALRAPGRDAAYRNAGAINANRGAASGLNIAQGIIGASEADEIVDNLTKRYDFDLAGSSVNLSFRDGITDAAVSDASVRYRAIADARSGDARSVYAAEYRNSTEYLRLVEEYGAVAYWPLDEPKGSAEGYEFIGGNNATYRHPNGAGVVTHEHGNLAPLVNADNEIIVAPHSEDYEVGAFTITLWVRTPWPSWTQGVIAKEDPAYNYAPQYAMYFHQGDLYFRGSLYYAGNYRQVRIDKSEFTTGEWCFIAVTCDASNRMRIYLNGKQEDLETGWTLGMVAYETNAYPWVIGGRRDDSDKPGYYDDPLIGSVARVAVFPSVLKESEIDDLYDASTLRDRVDVIVGSAERVGEP